MVCVFLVCSFSFSQEIIFEVQPEGDVLNPTYDEKGIENFTDFVNKEFDFSKVTKEGQMMSSFVISESGKITNIRITQMVDVESATEMIRVLSKSKNWKPAIKNGKPISVKVNYPFNFKLEEKKNTIVDNLIDLPKEKSSTGISEFYKYINENYRVPDVEGLKGKIIVEFTINEDGTLGDFKIIKDIGYGAAKELIRVLKKSSNKWTPGYKDGKPVKTTYTLPLNISTPTE